MREAVELIRATGPRDRVIHVWTVPTVAATSDVERFQQLLAVEERERAARFRFEHLRHSFILRRGVLRTLLGSYLDIHPAAVPLSYGSNGKPGVSVGDIRFNMSHSAGLALLAFTPGCEIGVDIELIRPLTDMSNIADRFFCKEEAAELASLPVSDREQAFFLCWSRKEAYIKGIGQGLFKALDSFQVTLRPGEPAQLVQVDGMSEAAKSWTLQDLKVSAIHAAALAYCDSPRPVIVQPVIEPARWFREQG